MLSAEHMQRLCAYTHLAQQHAQIVLARMGKSPVDSCEEAAFRCKRFAAQNKDSSEMTVLGHFDIEC